MPAAIVYDPEDKDLRTAAHDERLARESIQQRAEAWYDGDIPDVLSIKKHPKTGATMDNNIKLNEYAKRVDRRRDFLFPDMPQLDLDDMPDEDAAEKWLRTCWQWNKAATLWGLAVLNGAHTGQVYMRVLEPRPKRDLYPRCILLSNVITFWQADDVDTHLWYEVYYKVGKMNYRQDIVDLQAVGLADKGWGIYYYQMKDSDRFPIDQSANWEHVAGSDQLWDYDLGPIVTWQHWPRAARAYGAGEFGDIHLNQALNRTLSLGNAIIRNHAYPKTIVVGAAAGQLVETAVDGVWSLPEGAQVYNLEMQSDLSALMNMAGELRSAYNSQGRTVDIEGGPADFSNITNLAIKVSFMPQGQANEILQRQYGDAIVQASKRLQMIAKQAFDVDPVVNWQNALPESQLETSQVVTTLDTLHLASKETQAKKMDLDWLKEQERMKAEQQVNKIRRFGQQDVQQAQNAFNGLPSLDQLKAKQNGGNGNGVPGGGQ